MATRKGKLQRSLKEASKWRLWKRIYEKKARDFSDCIPFYLLPTHARRLFLFIFIIFILFRSRNMYVRLAVLPFHDIFYFFFLICLHALFFSLWNPDLLGISTCSLHQEHHLAEASAYAIGGCFSKKLFTAAKVFGLNLIAFTSLLPFVSVPVCVSVILSKRSPPLFYIKRQWR